MRSQDSQGLHEHAHDDGDDANDQSSFARERFYHKKNDRVLNVQPKGLLGTFGHFRRTSSAGQGELLTLAHVAYLWRDVPADAGSLAFICSQFAP